MEVLLGQADTIQAVNGMASLTNPSASSSRRARRATGKRNRNGKPNCSVPLRKWDTSSKESRADATTTTAKSVVKAAASANGNLPLHEQLCLARHDAHWLAMGASSVPVEVAERCEDDDEDPFGHGGALDEREEESAQSAHEAGPSEYHVTTLVPGSGIVHHTHETRLIRNITFCGKCGAWATTAPGLLTKELAKKPGRRTYELRRLIGGKELNRRTTWPRDTPIAPMRMYLAGETNEPEPVYQ